MWAYPGPPNAINLQLGMINILAIKNGGPSSRFAKPSSEEVEVRRVRSWDQPWFFDPRFWDTRNATQSHHRGEKKHVLSRHKNHIP